MIKKDLRRILLETIVLLAFGSLVGLSINYQLIIDAFSGRLTHIPEAPQAETYQYDLPLPVHLTEIDTLIAKGAVLVDARSRELYHEGHLPGAISLPLLEIESTFANFQEEVEFNKTLIVYCSGYGCPDSFDLGVFLLGQGYLDVRVFEGGVPEWQDSGRPVIEALP